MRPESRRRLRPGALDTCRATPGFTMVEAVIALTCAAIAILGLMGSVTAGSKLQQQTRDFGQAYRAAHDVHETLRNGDLDARVAEYKADPVFAVGSIEVEVRFPEQLLVDVTAGAVPAGWRYRDLDGDGEVDLDPAATGRASLVPVTVVARWADGQSSLSFLVTEK